MLPQTQYLSITTANLKTIQKKIEELNQQLIDQGSKALALNPTDLKVLAATIKQLEAASPNPDADSPALLEGVDVAIKIATAWPVDKRLPGLDLLRLLAAASPSVAIYTSSGDQTLVDVLAASGVFDGAAAPPNNTMLALRALANLFMTEQGRFVADGEFEKIHGLVQPFISSAIGNRNLIIAVTTLYINFAVQLTAPSHNADRALTLLDDLTKIINTVSDSEALYRALVGAGTLLALGEDFRTAAKEVFGFDTVLKRAESVGKEPRIRNVVAELRDELGP
jgi:phospholipase A-2-activating protein